MQICYIILFSLIFLLLLATWFMVGLYFLLDIILTYRSKKSLKEHDND